MAARLSDLYFMNGQPPAEAAEHVADVRARAAAHGREDALLYGLNGFAVVRDTEDEAQAVLEDIIEHADADKVEAFRQSVRQAGRSTADGRGMWADSDFRDLVQYNDGFRTGLVGTPDQVARRVLALKAAGVDVLLTGFLHVREEVERFGTDVIPRVRELEAQYAGAPVRELLA